MRASRGLWAWALVWALVSCSQEETAPKPHMTTVFANFYSDQPEQTVFVDSIYDLDSSASPGAEGLPGADVMLISPDTVIFLDSLEQGHYEGTVPIAETTTYTLRVESPLGDSYTLSSRSPQGFELLYPRPGDTLRPDSMFVSWTDPGNPFYLLRIYAQDTARQDPDGHDYEYEYFLWLWPNGDTSYQEIPSFVLDTVGYWYEFQLVASDTVAGGGDEYHSFTVWWSHRANVFVAR